MNSSEAVADRKRALVARGALQRLALRANVYGVEQAVRPGALLAQAASSPTAGSALLGFATLLAGGTRAGRLLRFAGAALALGRVFVAFLSRPPPPD